jgi:hypothetical protein
MQYHRIVCISCRANTAADAVITGLRFSHCIIMIQTWRRLRTDVIVPSFTFVQNVNNSKYSNDDDDDDDGDDDDDEEEDDNDAFFRLQCHLILCVT